jgi:hypothetical protein
MICVRACGAHSVNLIALPFGTIYDFLPRGDEQTSIAGAPSVRRSRPQKAINTIFKFTQAVKGGRRVEVGRKRA